jgi:hypothetical protein
MKELISKFKLCLICILSVHKLTFRAKRWAPNPSQAIPVIIKILLHRTEEALAQLVREYELFLALQEFELVCETLLSSNHFLRIHIS